MDNHRTKIVLGAIWVAIGLSAGCSTGPGPDPLPARAAGRVQAQSYQSVLIQGVPHVKQKPDFCGEACAAMYLSKLGETADQDYVFDRSGLDPSEGRGCYAAELKAALDNIGFRTGHVWTRLHTARRVEEGFEALHADLVKGIPSIVCMRYSDEPGSPEHFRLVLGYDAEKDAVIYHEPAVEDGAYRHMSRQTFLKTWPLQGRDGGVLVRMRLEPGDLEYGEISQARTPADYAQHVLGLKHRVPRGFTIKVEPPFVVIGDQPRHQVDRHAAGTVRLSAQLLKKDFFPKDPHEIIDIWLFKDRRSYRHHAKALFNHSPSTPYGYFSDAHNALVMNIATGGGTLIHEMVHAFMDANFPGCPPWLNEGLGSLYEGVDVQDGHLIGLINWRLPGLKAAIRNDQVPTFEWLTGLDVDDFYEKDPGTNYTQSRYLLYHLQERGLLLRLYHQVFENREGDPTGYRTLKSVLKVKDMDAFKRDWENWVLGL